MVLHTFNRAVLDSRGGPYEMQTIHGMLEFWAAEAPATPAVEFEVCHAPKPTESYINSLRPPWPLCCGARQPATTHYRALVCRVR